MRAGRLSLFRLISDITAALRESAAESEADIARDAPGRSMGLLFAYGDNVGCSLRFAVCGPCFHQLAALFQRIASPIGLLSLVADDMRQRRFRYLAREPALKRAHPTRPRHEPPRLPSCLELVPPSRTDR